MKVIIDTPEGIAKQAGAIYKEILTAKPDAVLGFATGSTPLDLYAELVRLYERIRGGAEVGLAHPVGHALERVLARRPDLYLLRHAQKLLV